MLQRSVDSVGEFQSDFGLHLLPWETSEVFNHSYGSGKRYLCVVEFGPLSQWEPIELKELVLV